MNEIQCWVSRNLFLDYRTVVAPNFMCQANITSLLAKSAEGDLTYENNAFYREIHGAKTGDLTAASGALAGLIVGVGIVAASPLSHRLMGQHGFKVWILEVGNDALNYVLMGLVLGAML